MFIKRPLSPLVKTTDSYVSPEFLQKYGIKVRPLDFDSGAVLDPKTREPDPSARAYTQLFPREAMQAYLRTNWPCPDDPLHWDECLDGWWHAYHIGNHLATCLRSSQGDSDILGLVQTIGLLPML